MRAADPVHNVELRRNSQGHDSVVFAFPYRADIVDAVRAIPGRRFDWEAKEWWAPRADAVAPFVKGVLERHPTLSVAPDVAEWLSRAVTGWIGRVTLGQARGPRALHPGHDRRRARRAAGRAGRRARRAPVAAVHAHGRRGAAGDPRRPPGPARAALRLAPAGGPRARAGHARRSSRATASCASSWTSTGTRRRCPPSSRCPPARRTGARCRSTRTCSSRWSTTCALFGVEPAANAREVLDRLRREHDVGDRRRAPLARRPTRRRWRSRTRLGGELRPFQRAGVAYVLQARRTFLADEQGLGKTVQALAALEADDAYPAVIVCPAGLKLNWLREIERWLPHRSVHVINGTGVAPMEAEITVLNYEIVHAHRVRLQLRRPKALVLDESHYVKNPRAKRTQAVRRLAEALPEGALKLALTGTPVMNHPDELIAQLRILGRLQEFGSGARFARRFQGAGAEERIHWHLRRSLLRAPAEGRRAAAAARQAPGRAARGARQRARVQARPGRRDRLAARAAAGPRRGRGEGRRRAARRAAGAAQRAQAARRARQGERGAGLDRGLPGLRRAAGRVRRPPRGAGAAARALPGRAAHPRPRLDPAARGGRGRLPGPGRPAADRVRHARRAARASRSRAPPTWRSWTSSGPRRCTTRPRTAATGSASTTP